MAKVTGVGGVFFKAREPGALMDWYRDALGLSPEEWGGHLFHWRDLRAPNARNCTVFSPFQQSTRYFEPSDKPFMLNLIVDDLDALLVTLRSRGAQVLARREDSAQGAFGYVLDPEGTLLELWQPNRADPAFADDAPPA